MPDVLELGSNELKPGPALQGARTVEGRFAKGFSGNISGKPKEAVSITRIIQLELEAKPERARKLANRLLELFEEGNATAIAQVIDRLDGTRVERKQEVAPDDPEKDEEAILLAAQAIMRKRERMAAELVGEANTVELEDGGESGSSFGVPASGSGTCPFPECS